MKAFKNSSNKQVRDAKKTLELSKKYSELNAKSIAETDKQIEEIIAKNKAKEASKNNLYDNKQITKQVYNVLNKTTTYK